MLKKWNIFALGILLIFSFSYSQIVETGSLSGRVGDSEGLSLPGVTVTISSPALILPQMATTTNVKGYFRFPSLSPGIYTVKFELDGFNTVVQEGIRANVGVATNLNITLSPKSLEEEIVVTGQAPTVDVQRTGLTTNFSKDFFASIPAPRELLNVVQMAPGMVGETSHGSTVRENVMNLDGVNVSDPFHGTMDNLFSVGIVEEVSVQTGGLTAEYGASRGAVVNVVSKSGGNRLSGGGEFYFIDNSLQSDNAKGTPFEGEELGFEHEYSAVFNLGGPIIKDRLWFFGNFEYIDREEYEFGYPWDQDENIPVSADRIFSFGKLTFQINPSNKLTLNASARNNKYDHQGANYNRNVDATRDRTVPVYVLNLNYQRIFTSNLMMNVKVGYYNNHLKSWSRTGLPRYYDRSTRLYSVGYGYDSDYAKVRYVVFTDATYFVDDMAGRHEFKVGATYENIYTDRDMGFSRDERGYGPYIYTRDGAPYEVRFRDDYHRKEKQWSFGAYFQDSWQPTERLAINLGVRFDHQEGYVPPQGDDRDPKTFNGITIDPRVPERIDVLDWNSFSPRFGAVYDITGDGKTVFKTSFARYYVRGITTWIDEMNPNDVMEWRYRLNSDWSLNLARGVYGISGGADKAVDADLKIPYLDEFTIGIEREIISNLSLSLRYIRKWDRNVMDDADLNLVDENALKEGNLVWKNYQSATAIDPDTGETVTFYDMIDDSIPEYLYITNPPGAERDYDGLEIVLKKRLANNWMLIASYVYAKSRGLIGLTAGDNELANDLFNNQNAHINALGRLPGERRHQFKLNGAVMGPFGINLSGYFRALAGRRYTRVINSDDLGLDLNQGDEDIFAEEKGSRGLPAQYILDLRLEKVFNLPNRIGRISLMLDAFNIFNANTATSVEPVSSSSSLIFEEARSIPDPRLVRFGIKFEF